MSHFPEISNSQVNQILLRLPVKSLLRFRCLSKTFCAEIDSPNFVKGFLDRSLKTSADFNIVISKGPMLYSLKFPCVDDLTTAEATELDHPFKDPTCEVLVVGSCNGILCLQKLGICRDFILWNPATGQYRKVEAPNCSDFGNDACYFGYNHVKDDYNVVGISRNQESYDISVYSLKTDSWAKINQQFPYQTCWLESGAFLRGAVHWLASASKFDRFVEPDVIVAFDLGTETFSQIQKPSRSGHYCAMMGVYDLGGHLCLVSSELESGFRLRSYMWVMENNGVEEWTPLSPVKTKEIGFRPFAYYPQGSKQVLGMLGSTLTWRFPEKSRLKVLSVRGLQDCNSFTFNGCTCFESLVPI